MAFRCGDRFCFIVNVLLYLEFREPILPPAPLLEQLDTVGYRGRKTGRGFRDYG
ncbi:hypothetical protein AB0I10_32515 [Streptomyces sp. NPDC050636]|uniref:hypothetical protein n=1 Tax=Streptomyces sp. NPDC050636 TaxID=3154510 RepID=UPI00342598C6